MKDHDETREVQSEMTCHSMDELCQSRVIPEPSGSTTLYDHQVVDPDVVGVENLGCMEGV